MWIHIDISLLGAAGRSAHRPPGADASSTRDPFREPRVWRLAGSASNIRDWNRANYCGTWGAPGGPTSSEPALETGRLRNWSAWRTRARSAEDAHTTSHGRAEPCCACSPPSIRTLTTLYVARGRRVGYLRPPSIATLQLPASSHPSLALLTRTYIRPYLLTLWWPCGGRLGISAFGPPSL